MAVSPMPSLRSGRCVDVRLPSPIPPELLVPTPTDSSSTKPSTSRRAKRAREDDAPDDEENGRATRKIKLSAVSTKPTRASTRTRTQSRKVLASVNEGINSPPAEVRSQAPAQRPSRLKRKAIPPPSRPVGPPRRPEANHPASIPLDAQRRLRSHDGRARPKSELAAYFPNYDEVLGFAKPDPEHMNSDTEIIIEDSEEEQPPRKKACLEAPETAGRSKSAAKPKIPLAEENGDIPGVADDSGKLHNCQRLNFSSVEMGMRKDQFDPLTVSFYEDVHRRAQRREKRQRNIEQNKAQHERDCLARTLAGLQGPDWLRVLGVSAVTASEKKAYEPKRDFFIEEVTALLERFRTWKEEEKRRRVAKERGMLLGASQSNGKEKIPAGLERPRQHPQVEDDLSDGNSSDHGDADASATRQLRREAKLATNGRSTPAPSHVAADAKKVSDPSAEEEPLTSFYKKKYQRTAAVGNHRRSERHKLAFGHPLPQMEEDQDFQLPGHILSSEAASDDGRTQRVSNREKRKREVKGE
ncbi:MAG: hypothetical protein M1826_005842 [Phylliscum demangeonii]|nr:MAG: hypothetical protein M1826_005842 [Phylliscum demangeonii]